MSYIGSTVMIKMKAFEGCVNHMYLDTRGSVTIGVGQLVSSAEAAKELLMLNNDTHTEASEDAIMEEYDRIVVLGSGRTSKSYKSSTTLYMPTKFIDVLLDSRLLDFELQLKNQFNNYNSMPSKAKLGLMDMIFNLGSYGLRSKFPKFTHAARNGHWKECAKECHRTGISDQRNEWTEKMFGSAGIV